MPITKSILTEDNKIAYLAVIPFLVLIYCLAMRPYILPMYIGYLQSQDPAYCYLFTSLPILSTLKAPYFVLHPGTPLQIIIAVIIFIVSMFQAIASNSSINYVERVILNPELYLNCISIVLLTLNLTALTWLGKKIYQASGSLALAILVQLFPFALDKWMFLIEFVSGDALELTFAMVFVGSLAPLIFTDARTPLPAKEASPRFSGLALGLGLATKMSLVPFSLLLLAFQDVRRFRKAVWYAIVGFLAGTAPAWKELGTTIGYVFQEAIHMNANQTGGVGFINTKEFLPRVTTLYRMYEINFFVLAFAVILLAYCLVGTRNSLKRSFIIPLLAHITSFSLAVIIIVKHYTPYIMIFYVLTSYIFLAAVISTTAGKLRVAAISAAISVLVALGVYQSITRIDNMKTFRAEEIKAQHVIEDYLSRKNTKIAFAESVHNMRHAILYGIRWTQNKYLDNLVRLNLHQLYYDIYEKNFYFDKSTNMTPDEIRSIIDEGNNLYLLGYEDLTPNKHFVFTPITKVPQGKMLYQVTVKD